MPLYEVNRDGDLIPFRRLHGGGDLYESEIEDLLWDNLDELTGESLFRIARQPNVTGGGRPDIVALDSVGRVVVIEVKRDVDRNQLAQCLEYAGWARTTTLDELSSRYHRGRDAFFADWQEFTGSDVPAPISRSPKLILVARDFHGRTGSAFDYLIEHGVPVQLVPLTMYEDRDGRRLVDVEADREPSLLPGEAEAVGGTLADHTKVDGRRVRITDLLDADLLMPGDKLTWERPRLGESYEAEITDRGTIRLPDDREFASPSKAAMSAAKTASFDGWYAWRVTRHGNVLLNELRHRLAAARAAE